jgi:hypothetical protein
VRGLVGYRQLAAVWNNHAKDQVKIICRTIRIGFGPGSDKTKTINQPFGPNSFPTVLQLTQPGFPDKKPADISRRVRFESKNRL